MFARDPGFEVVGEAADGAAAVRLAGTLRPDVILMDLRMPGLDGVGALAELARLGSTARVLVLTTYDTDSYVLPAIEAGATGYLLKDAPRAELLRAVRAAARGEGVLSPSVATRLMTRVRAPSAQPLSTQPLPQPARVRGPRADRRREHQPGGRRPPAHQRGHGQDPPAQHLRQARCQRPRRRRRRGLPPRPAGPRIAARLTGAGRMGDSRPADRRRPGSAVRLTLRKLGTPAGLLRRQHEMEGPRAQAEHHRDDGG